METYDDLTVRFEPCAEHAGDHEEPCAGCGWLLDDHRDDRGVAAPVIPIGAPLPLAA